MPLHLLGKKSWNVYNPENVARVRHDEAVAKTEEEQRERQQRKAEVDDRLALLRGEPRTASTTHDSPQTQRGGKHEARKRRRPGGEGETSHEIRLAEQELEKVRSESLKDGKGNFNLFPDQKVDRSNQDTHLDNISNMRLRDAGGRKSDGRGPWYTNSRLHSHDNMLQMGKNVWGDEDPKRKERENSRLEANDPILAMKKGVKQLRDVERQRQEWKEQRERDLYEVEEMARQQNREGRHHKRKHGSDQSANEDFTTEEAIRDRHRHRHRHKHRQHGHHHVHNHDRQDRNRRAADP